MRRFLALTALTAFTALVPATAHAATSYSVDGAGFGHGVGMSQYGAYGMAQHGWSYSQILSHYYTGTNITRGDPARLRRVLLQASRIPGAEFTGATALSRIDLTPTRTYIVRPYGSSGIEVRSEAGTLKGRFSGPVRIARANGGVVKLLGLAMNGTTSGQYRGKIEFRRGLSGGITSVNVVKLDDYLLGVVPIEMPASWSQEALRAQAVAARTYAYTENRGGEIYDHYPDTRSQVYKGYDYEHSRTNTAVTDTGGKILRYNGPTVARTFFFSTSGGRTENVENSLGGDPIPYLVSVEDPYDDVSPLHTWRKSFSQADMQSRLSGYVKGTFVGIEVTQRGVSPRIVRANVVGTGGETSVSGATLMARLSLYDTWAHFTRISTRASRSAAARTSGAESEESSSRDVARTLTGTVSPRPTGGRIAVQRRVDGEWQTVERTRAFDLGAYSVVVEDAGVYRVKAGRAVGPAVRVR